MTDAAKRFNKIMSDLLVRRRAGPLSQGEESEAAASLEGCWTEMDDCEQAESDKLFCQREEVWTDLKPWRTIESRTEYSCRAMSVIGKTSASESTGVQSELTVLKYPDWVNIAAVTPDRQIVLARQFRHGVERFTFELPGETIDEGESPLDAAKRELAEEAKCSADSWESLGCLYANPAINTNQVHLCFATGAKMSDGLPEDPDEEIEILYVPMCEAVAMCLDGRIMHPFTHAAIFALMLRHPSLFHDPAG